MPLPDFVNALQRWSVAQNKDWFGYKESTAEAPAVVAASLHTTLCISSPSVTEWKPLCVGWVMS